MKKTSIVILLLPLRLMSQPNNAEENYWQYHKWVMQAENAFFENNNIDSCLFYYDMAFDNYSFNYVNDLVNAAQIAYYTQKNESSYHHGHGFEHYIHKAVKFGLRSSHIQRIPAWKDSDVYVDFQKFEKTQEGLAYHREYLNSINVDYLCLIYNLCIEDEKMTLDKYEDITTNRYIDSILMWNDRLLYYIEEYGFPGQKLLGIDDDKLFEELGIPCLDFATRVQKDSAKLSWIIGNEPMIRILPSGDTFYIEYEKVDTIIYKMNTDKLSQNLLEVFFVHHCCPPPYLEEYAIQEIAKGNLHPRFYAFLSDLNGWDKRFPSLCPEGGIIKFKVSSSFANLQAQSTYTDDMVDFIREKYCICSVAADNAKISFGKEHGFVFRWGHTQYF